MEKFAGKIFCYVMTIFKNGYNVGSLERIGIFCGRKKLNRLQNYLVLTKPFESHWLIYRPPGLTLSNSTFCP